jgi:colanic acid biosynthesis glycosyl transferase WcaI
MRILVLCPHYAPDVAPTGEVMTSIVEGLAARGHRLHVVTSLPWYEHHRVEVDWRGSMVHHADVPWGRITRVHPFPTDKTNLVARAVGFAGFTGLSGLEGAITRSRPDVVLAMSPPLTLGPAAVAIGRLRRIPVVFNIQDVFPDVAVELGMLTNAKVIAAASWLERATYAHADAVTVLSDDLRDNVVAKLAGRSHRKGGDPDKVRVIPNFVDTVRIAPAPHDNAYRRELGLEGKTVVLYAGNVGFSQSLDLVLAAARSFAGEPSVAFVINGGGSARPALEADAAGMANVHFVDFQPRERLAEVLAAGDIHLVPLRRGLARSSVPSKTYSILAAGRPFVASIDPGTEIERIAERSGAGIAVAPDDPEAFTAAVRRLVDDPTEAQRMGAAGRRWVEGWASPAAVAESYETLFAELVARR